MGGSNEQRRVPDTGQQEALSPEGLEGAWETTVKRDILVGQRLGEYVVRRRIGSGGMGVVYEGEHPVIGRKVAIKLIRPDSSDALRSRDLVAEARATSTIRHRGIIDIFGFGELPGIGQYLVMEFLDGRPLDEVLQERAPLSLPEALRLITEVLGALSAAHGAGVIHRDLKPGNIFVVLESNGSEYVKVLDFGLAKQATAAHAPRAQTQAGMVVGTPEYMAPEQACGQAVSPRTDLYAVGVLLFEMVTGRLPFEGDSPMQVAVQHVQAPPPVPSSLVEGLPPALDAFILRLLEKDPDKRPGSAEEAVRELKGLSRALAAEMTQLSGVARAHSARVPAASGARAPGDSPGASPTVVRPGGRESSSLDTTRIPGLEPAALAPTAGSRPKWGLPVGIALMMLGVGAAWMMTRSSGGGSSPPVMPTPETVAAVPSPPSAPVPVVEPAVEPAPTRAEPEAPVARAEPEGVVSTPPPGEPDADEPRRAVRDTGSLQLVSACWSSVYIDGELRGRAPLRPVSLSVGAHLLELRGNPAVETYRTRFLIRAGKTLELVAPCRQVER